MGSRLTWNKKVVSNTGPLIHLSQIELLKTLNIFSEIFIPEEVVNELKRNKIEKFPNKVKIVDLTSKSKDLTEFFVNKFDLDLGESQAIALTLQERTGLFLTDDLEARTIANSYRIEVHGTLGVILRAFRERIIDKETTIKKLDELYSVSTLFITKNLVEHAIKSVEEFKRN